MRKTRSITAVAVLLSLLPAACSSVRQAKPLAYAGDGRSTVASLQVSIEKRGYKAICHKEEFCKFAYNEQVTIHFKASKKRVVMAVDVAGGKEMPAARAQALTDEATAVGDAIWAEASVDAEKRARQQAQAEAEAEERDRAEAARKANEPRETGGASPGGGFGGVLETVGGVLGSVKVEGGASNGGAAGGAQCCINRAYYSCPSAAAVNKCAGETSACLMKCMQSSEPGCGDRCLQDHPPDPSGCTRAPEKDGDCKG